MQQAASAFMKAASTCTSAVKREILNPSSKDADPKFRVFFFFLLELP